MYRSYTPTCYICFFFYTTLYDCILFYGPIVPEINYSILFYSIIKFHQVLIENDLQLDINAKLDLESQNKNQK